MLGVAVQIEPSFFNPEIKARAEQLMRYALSKEGVGDFQAVAWQYRLHAQVILPETGEITPEHWAWDGVMYGERPDA